MNRKLHAALSRMMLASLLLAGVTDAAHAVTYHLRAGVTTKTLPDGQSVTVWGFADDTAAGHGNGQITVPGPSLVVPPGDETLVVSLENTLTPAATGVAGGVSVSLFIAGQASDPTPARFSDSAGRSRARSFTKEVAPGASATYTFSGFRPGSFIYHSGSQPGLQVAMGLYGAAIKDSATGTAYEGVLYDNQAVVFFSELDPALSAAVSSGQYGTASYPSMLQYNPKYFLINGQPFSGNPASPGNLPALEHPISGEETVLLRFFNAGLKSHVPQILNSYFRLIAEDGNLAPYPRTSYSTLLPALKTLDAIFEPAGAGVFALYDRSLHLTNGWTSHGGLTTFIASGPVILPVAGNDTYQLDEDSTLSVPAALGVMANDTGRRSRRAVLVSNVSKGTLSLAADGSFVYQPAPDSNGLDNFSYKVINGKTEGNTATVSLNVIAKPDAPIANADIYAGDKGKTLKVAASGVLANDFDADGDGLTAHLVQNSKNGTVTLRANGSFDYVPNAGFSGEDTFTYTAYDGILHSSPATVSLSIGQQVSTNAVPLARNDTANTKRNKQVRIRVLRNDSDSDGTLVRSSLRMASRPRRGSISVRKDGTVYYKPRRNYLGWDKFSYTVRDNAGAVSNKATVRIRVRR